MDAGKPILVASGDIESRQSLQAILLEEGLETIAASRLTECEEILSKDEVSLVFCDRRLGDGSYRDLLNLSKSLNSAAKVIITSIHADWDEYMDVLKQGAFDLIAAPCRSTDVLWTLSQAARETPLRAPQKPAMALSAAAGNAV